MARPLAALVEQLGVQARVKVATTRADGGGIDTFRALQPDVTMVGTVGETISFALLWLLGSPDTVQPKNVCMSRAHACVRALTVVEM